MVKHSVNNNKISSIKLSVTGMLDEYRQSLETANKSPRTISWYFDILHAFFTFLESSGLMKPIDELGRKELGAYIRSLQDRKRWPNRVHHDRDLGKLSPAAVQGHVRAIKAFWSWLTLNEDIKKNPLAKFPLPKVPQYLIQTLSNDHIKKLLSAIDKNTTLGAKYYCILMLLLDTGVRISELVNIRMDDLGLTHGLITMLGKGQKERVVPFSKWVRKELLRYITNFRANFCSEDSSYLFPTGNGEHISVNSVQQFMRRLVKKAGLDGIRCSPHIFRYTFATRAFANEANVFVVKEIMGHPSKPANNYEIYASEGRRPENSTQQVFTG